MRAADHISACLVVTVVTLVATTGCGGMRGNENAEGVQLYQQGNYQGAANAFQQALAKQPGNPDSFYNLGATYHQQAKLFNRPADLQLAEQYYHLCLSRNPDHAACHRALAVLLVEEGRSSDAVASLEAWAAASPTDPEPRLELARLSYESGDVLAAENHLIDAISVAPADPRPLVALGCLREQTGQTGQALANYSRALALDPQQPMVSAKVASLSSVPPVPAGAVMAQTPATAAPVR
jgi:tetratricopeptide (TPR) repeat protein